MNLKFQSRIHFQLNKILWIIMIWTVISVFLMFGDYALYKAHDFYPENFDLSNYLLTSFVSGVLAGILGGSIVVFLMEGWLRSKPFGTALLYILISYLLISTTISAIASFTLFSMQNDSVFYSQIVIDDVLDFFAGPLYLRTIITWLIIVLGTIFMLMVNDKYGPGVLVDFLKGKYFRPRKEERIFMFLDMRSSTSIAEELGEELYFRFLKRVFSDITPSIIYSKGEIYQYVGDEIVISWKVSAGKQKANCIKCFYHIQDTLKNGEPDYIKTFGVVPEFKAGIHYGHVVAGEIGVVKKDITFSGDVLNTAARIQSKCNEFGVNILISKYLLDKLSLAPNIYNPEKIGELLLRGKGKLVTLYTI